MCGLCSCGDVDEESINSRFSTVNTELADIATKINDISISVKDKTFGAVGDGIASDSVAFQTALDLAKNTDSGVTIRIPDGTYRMTEELKIYSNTFISCGANVKIVRDHKGYLMVNGFRKTEATPTTATAYSGNGNLVIDGGTWDGNGVNQPSKASIFHLGHADNIKISNATFKDAANSHHIEFNACQHVHVTKCKFLGWIGTTDTFNEAIQLDISKMGGTTIGADDETPCRHVYITDCYFGQIAGTKVARAIGSHTASINRWHENINIVGCIFEDTQSFAIRAYSWRKVTIKDNVFSKCGAGINVRTPMAGTEDSENELGIQTNASQVCDNYVISGNEFIECGFGGRVMEIYGETTGKNSNVQVVNNIIRGNGVQTNIGIYIVYSDDVTIMGNQITGIKGTTSTNAITVTNNSENIMIANNTIKDMSGGGMHITTSSHHLVINGNTIRQVGLNSIYVSGTTNNVTVTGNNLVGCNGSGGGATVNFIRMSSTVKRVTISGNVCMNYSTTHVANVALDITSSCTEVVRSGNNFKGFKLADSSTGSMATGDLT